MPVRPALAALGLAAAALAAAAAAPVAAAPPPAYAVTGSIPGQDGGWDYVSFDPALRRLYVTHADGVFVVEVDSGKVTQKLADAPRPHQVVPLDAGKVLLVTVGGDNTARFLDAETGRLLGQVATGKAPDGAIYDAPAGLVAVADHSGGDLLLIDPKTMKAAGDVTVGGVLEYLATDDKGRVFVNVEDKGELAVIDPKTRAVVQRVKLEGCEEPGGLAYAPHAGVMLAACGNGKAAVVEAASLKQTGLLDIGQGPDAVIYDPERRLAFVPCGRSGELDVIDASEPGHVRVVGKLETERSARTGMVDPKTGKIYLPSARFDPPAQPGQRPTLQPGSFHLVVVSPAR